MYRLVSAIVVVCSLFSAIHSFAAERTVTAKKYLNFQAAKKKSARPARYLEFPKVLSYNDLMMLAPYKRVEYLTGLRAMLVELSRMSKKGRGTYVSDNSGINILMNPDSLESSEESYNALLKIIDIILPRAFAREVYSVNFPSAGIKGRQCTQASWNQNSETIQMLGTEGKYYCFEKSTYSEWKRTNANRLWTLDKDTKAAEIQQRDTQKAEAQAVKERTAMKDHQKSLDDFHAEEERKAMVAHQTFTKEQNDGEAERNAAIGHQQFAKSQDDAETERKAAIGHQDFAKSRDDAEAERNAAIGHQQFVKSQDDGDTERNAMIAHQRFTEDQDAKAIAQAKAKKDEEAASELSAIQSQDKKLAEKNAEEERKAMAGASDFYGERAVGTQMAENAKPKPAMNVAAGDAVPDPSKPAPAMAAAAPASVEPVFRTDADTKKCKDVLLTCEENAINADKKKYQTEKTGRLKDFRDSSPDACISSGNMSGYRNGEVKAGNCKPVNIFCYNPEDEECVEKGKYKSGESRKEREKANPGEPTGIGEKKTFKCEKGSLCNPLVFGAWKNGKGLCVENGGADITVICDKAVSAIKEKGKDKYTFDVLKEGGPGVANAWDDWRDKFNKTCKGGEKSQLAHCEECAVISRRLREMNRMAKGTCDYGLNYNEMQKYAPKDSGETPKTTN